jgi:hypothetical protein
VPRQLFTSYATANWYKPGTYSPVLVKSCLTRRSGARTQPPERRATCRKRATVTIPK